MRAATQLSCNDARAVWAILYRRLSHLEVLNSTSCHRVIGNAPQRGHTSALPAPSSASSTGDPGAGSSPIPERSAPAFSAARRRRRRRPAGPVQHVLDDRPRRRLRRQHRRDERLQLGAAAGLDPRLPRHQRVVNLRARVSHSMSTPPCVCVIVSALGGRSDCHACQVSR